MPSDSVLLCDLPIEIVSLVAGYLDQHDLYHLRLACRELQRKTLTVFAKYFTAHIVWTNRLDSLVELSNHPLIREVVQELWFHTECPTEADFEDVLDAELHSETRAEDSRGHDISGQELAPLQSDTTDCATDRPVKHDQIRATLDSILLKAVFQRLPHLKYVGYYSYKPGEMFLYRTPKNLGTMPVYLYPSRILAALGRAELQLEELILGSQERYFPLQILHLPGDCYGAYTGVTSLDLNLCSGWNQGPIAPSIAAFTKLLAAMAALKRLVLRLMLENQNLRALLEAQATLRMSCLEDLDLELHSHQSFTDPGAVIPPLSVFLLNHRHSLRHLKLCHIDSDTRHFRRFLLVIRNNLSLETLCLSEWTTRGGNVHVQFTIPDIARERDTFHVDSQDGQTYEWIEVQPVRKDGFLELTQHMGMYHCLTQLLEAENLSYNR